MRKPPFHYTWGKAYDDDLPKLVEFVRYAMDKNNDDFRLLIVGETGTGKSTLAMHIDELFRGPEKVTISTYGLNEKTYARAIKAAQTMRQAGEQRVTCVYDEANVYGVEAMKKFNIHLTRMLAEIRGLKVFHIWCMPNPELLPSSFLDNTFNAIIFIFTKENNTPRRYDFLGRKAIDDLRLKEGTKMRKARISLDMLRKFHRKYAQYRGCFKKYDGVLLAPYLELKNSKISDRIDSFFDEFGEDELRSPEQTAKQIGVSRKTVDNWIDKFMSDGLMVRDEHFIVTGAGLLRLNAKGLDLLIKKQQNNLLKHSSPRNPAFQETKELNITRPNKKTEFEAVEAEFEAVEANGGS